MVIPVASPRGDGETLTRVVRDGDTFTEEQLAPVRFVPLIGREGYAGARRR
jgi:protein-L-isoaspartate O-methyltransferase